jgi:hypothetical protein
MGDEADLVLDPPSTAETLLDAGFADYAIVAALIDNHDLVAEEAEAVLRAALGARRPFR